VSTRQAPRARAQATHSFFWDQYQQIVDSYLSLWANLNLQETHTRDAGVNNRERPFESDIESDMNRTVSSPSAWSPPSLQPSQRGFRSLVSALAGTENSGRVTRRTLVVGVAA
jgi:hypothetical protein